MTKMFFAMAIAATLGVGATVASRLHTAPQDDVSELVLKNIEALGNDEDDCHYINGYKQWKTERPWWWSSQQSFYDCCANRVTGYSPEGECK